MFAFGDHGGGRKGEGGRMLIGDGGRGGSHSAGSSIETGDGPAFTSRSGGVCRSEEGAWGERAWRCLGSVQDAVVRDMRREKTISILDTSSKALSLSLRVLGGLPKILVL